MLSLCVCVCIISILAELMLPDGAHNRDQDWTIFFLNQALPEVNVNECSLSGGVCGGDLCAANQGF